MGFDSIWHWLILLVIVLVIFGTGKLTKIGPDMGRAVREFKKALHDDDKDDATFSSESLKDDSPDKATADSTQKQEQHATDHSK